MRLWFAPLTVLTTCLSVSASVADAAPAADVRSGLPYLEARRSLVDRGFQPVRVERAKHLSCPGDPSVCAAYPELLDCAADAPVCRLAYWRSADDTNWIVTVYATKEASTSLETARRWRYSDRRLADASDLEDFLVVLPNGQRRSYLWEDRIPLCSNTVRLNCRNPAPKR